MATRNGVPAGLTSEVVKVTPTIAAQWLETMKHNRKLSTINVEKLVQQMKNGYWVFDGSPIKFNRKGELVDGQHRLWALIEADYTADFMVVRGVPEEAFLTMDTGKSRGFADMLAIKHPEVQDLNNVAATTQIALRWELGLRNKLLIAGRSNTISTHQLMLFFEENQERIINASKLARVGKVTGIPGRALDLLAYLVLDIDADDAAFFFERLHDGVGLDAGSSILTLRNLGQQYRGAKGQHTDLPPATAVALAIKAWNFFRDGVDAPRLQFRPGGATPERFPEPH